jgi:hypothetical protein
MSEACADARDPLLSIFPGSWINGDFYIWIGHADDHRAWSQLVDARRALDSPPAGLSDASLARAREELLIAEGSDWFWWYGDDHSSDHDLEFDDLFRRHVRNVYRALETPIPEELFVTNITTRPPVTRIRRPTGFIHPTIDGEVSSYFEWIGAGGVEDAPGAGTMHQVAARTNGITQVAFGFDAERLYIRIEGARPMRDLLVGTFGLTLKFLKPSGIQVVVRRDGRLTDVLMVKRTPKGDWDVATCAGLASAIGRVAESACRSGVSARSLATRSHSSWRCRKAARSASSTRNINPLKWKFRTSDSAFGIGESEGGIRSDLADFGGFWPDLVNVA